MPSPHDRNPPRSHIVDRLIQGRAVAVIRLKSPSNLMAVVEALRDGGITSIEITLTMPDAVEMIRRIDAAFSDDEILLGAGSVRNGAMTTQAIEAGARFVVSPIFRRDIVDIAHQHGVAAIPGALTPTEFERAHEAGADIVKLFPAGTVGKKYVGALTAPLPHLRIMPTGGVRLDDAAEWLRAGASAVGIGSDLVSSEAVANGDYDALMRNAQALRVNIESAS